MKLCELIKRGRRAIDISKTQLAEKVGCTARAIEYWESGERKISLENADKVFKALDITVCIGKRKNKVVKVRNIEMFDNKELTRVMSMVVNESVKIQKE